jgi:hypothetical protein
MVRRTARITRDVGGTTPGGRCEQYIAELYSAEREMSATDFISLFGVEVDSANGGGDAAPYGKKTIYCR